MTYNPNQPRDPAGTPTGGQWSSDQLNKFEDAARKAAGLPMSRERYEQIVSEHKAGAIAIANEAPKTPAPKNLQKYIDTAYEMGVRARSMGITSGQQAVRYDEFYMGMSGFEKPEFVAFEAGLKGVEKPYWVNGWRYGEIPEGGSSRNFAEGIMEAGVSFMATDNGMATGDVGFELFTTGRKIIYGSGFLNTVTTGSDGEPLLLWPRKTGTR